MKKSVKIIIILLVLNGLVFTIVSLVKVKSATAQQRLNPLTFYCQLDEEFVASAKADLENEIYSLEAQLNWGNPDNPVPPPPMPDGGVPPGGSVSLNFPNNASNSIARRAWEIVNNLQHGFWNDFNRSPGYPDLFDEVLFSQNPNLDGIDTSLVYVNMFWCTQLVMKSYSETGHPIPSNVLVTIPMSQYFQNQGRYITNPVISDMSAGDAIFFGSGSSLAHVGIIYSISPNSITTVEANAPWKSRVFTANPDGTFPSSYNIASIGKP